VLSARRVPAAAPPPETTLPVLPPLDLPAGSVSLLSTADLLCVAAAVLCKRRDHLPDYSFMFSPARPPARLGSKSVV